MIALSQESPKLTCFVAGRWQEPKTVKWLQSLDPSRPADVVAQIPRSEACEIDAAVEAAAQAFLSWSQLSGPVRAELLYRWADAIAAAENLLTEAIVREVGKPIGEARGEVKRCVAILRYFAGEAVRTMGTVVPSQSGEALQYSMLAPLGVVALITPWNFPVAIPLWKAAPAIAMGNTVVLKPSEHSGFVAKLLAETVERAGLPAGVFNVLFGAGETGELLVNHPDVKAVSFTGSSAVGRQIAGACAFRNIKFQTEMGGKNAAIVLEDADLLQAAKLVAGGAMRFAGQKCTATSRVIVAKPIRDTFLNLLTEEVSKLPVGDPLVAATAVGPVITESSFVRLNALLAENLARSLYVGKAPEGDLAAGFFVPPAILEVSDKCGKLAQEELFGPVLSYMVADDFDHAIELANSTSFGLSASLFTRDIQAALKYVHRIEAGLVRVNADTTGVDPHAPFGGVKGSSSHTREQGAVAKDFYTEIKTVQIGS